jgi:hypothetical protein
MTDKHILTLFKAMVVEATGPIDLTNAANGFLTNFIPTPLQLKLLREEFKPLNLTTLFSVEERMNGSVYELLTKQLLHYIEIYGLDSPGLFDLEQTNGKVVTLTYVQGISKVELGEKVRTLLYANAPIKDTPALKEIIEAYQISYEMGLIKNNEMKMLLFKVGRDKFEKGDDAVRYMCYVATESALLIKSKQVIKAIEADASLFTTKFFQDHENALAQVFHRHKNLILAAKTSENRGVINRISRRAKDAYVPIHEPISKRFISEAYNNSVGAEVLSSMSVRDKFKFLNLLAYKSLGNTTDAFMIRNGKVHVEKGRKVLNPGKLIDISHDVLNSLGEDLKHLHGKTILIDSNVDYGLPISRKQAIGQLPFGTTITPKGDILSSGIYWENSGGARDLDLSAVQTGGKRVGWGRLSGYNNKDVVFSGDLIDATNGAMEFMTSKTSFYDVYALYVNIFAGEPGAKFSLVVGSRSTEKWIEDPVVREAGELLSRGNIIGFVKNGKFVVYSARMNNASWSEGSKEQAIVARGLAPFWTVRSLLETLGIGYYIEQSPTQAYDHDLSYQSFSYDKLEAMLTKV